MIKFINWNILKRIKGQKPFEYSKWLSSSFEDKIVDAIYTIFIAYNWLLLGIFIFNYKLLSLLATILLKKEKNETNIFQRVGSSILFWPSMVLQGLGVILMSTLVAITILPLLPIIGLIHLISLGIKSFKLNKESLLNMSVCELDNNGESTDIIVRNFLKKNKSTFQKAHDASVWHSTSELHVSFPDTKNTMVILLNEDTIEPIFNLSQVNPKVLRALINVNYFERVKPHLEKLKSKKDDSNDNEQTRSVTPSILNQ